MGELNQIGTMSHPSVQETKGVKFVFLFIKRLMLSALYVLNITFHRFCVYEFPVTREDERTNLEGVHSRIT